jgi:hypothetical protein
LRSFVSFLSFLSFYLSIFCFFNSSPLGCVACIAHEKHFRSSQEKDRKICRSDGGGNNLAKKMLSIRLQKAFHTQPTIATAVLLLSQLPHDRQVRHCQSCATTLPLPKPEVLFRSRWKSNRVFLLFLFICFHVNLGGLHSGNIARQVLSLPTVLILCLLCLLLCWQRIEMVVAKDSKEIWWRRKLQSRHLKS